MRPSVPDVHITDSQDAELSAYRPLAGQAVAGLLLGLLSPLALAHPAAWSIPALGVFFCRWALRRIKKSDAALAGRNLARAGMALSLVFLAAAPADWLSLRWHIRAEARQFSALWFKYLAEDELHKAHQLTVAPQNRRPLDDRLVAFYRESARAREEREAYATQPLVRTLSALGPGALVRFYETANQSSSGNTQQVDQTYAVTYEEQGGRKTFFVTVRMVRVAMPGGKADWRILQTEGGVRPEGWQ